MHRKPWPTLRLAALALAGLTLGGCVTQRINLAAVPQAPPNLSPQAQLRHFKETTQGIYLLFDTIPVKRARVQDAMAEHNPEGKPVANLKVTSRGGSLAALLSLGTGLVLNRGLLISLNQLVVEGDVVESATSVAEAPAAPPASPRR